MQFQCFYYKRLWGFIRVDSRKGFHIMGLHKHGKIKNV